MSDNGFLGTATPSQVRPRGVLDLGSTAYVYAQNEEGELAARMATVALDRFGATRVRILNPKYFIDHIRDDAVGIVVRERDKHVVDAYQKYMPKVPVLVVPDAEAEALVPKPPAAVADTPEALSALAAAAGVSVETLMAAREVTRQNAMRQLASAPSPAGGGAAPFQGTVDPVTGAPLGGELRVAAAPERQEPAAVSLERPARTEGVTVQDAPARPVSDPPADAVDMTKGAAAPIGPQAGRKTAATT